MGIRLELPVAFSIDYPSQLDQFPSISGLNKVVANHLVDNEITNETKYAKGVTHLQYIYDPTFPKDKKCYVLLADGFGGSTPTDDQINAYADSLATLITANAAIGDQFVEASSGAIPTNNYFTVAKKFYERLSIKTGVSGAANNNFYGSYVTDEANFSVDFFSIIGTTGRNPTHARFKAALANQTGARKHARNVDVGDGGSPQSEDGFYTSSMHDFCNSFTMMLFANDSNPLDWLYYGIFEMQRKYAAKATAKTLTYTSPWAQSVLTPVNTHSRNPRWIHERTGGYWKHQNWHVVPFQYMLWVGFFGCLIGEGCYIWEAGVKWSKNKANDHRLPTGPGYPDPPIWVSTGGSEPTLINLTGDNAVYPQYPETGCDATMVGVHWFNRIKPILDSSPNGVEYCPYTLGLSTSVGIQKPDSPWLFKRGQQNFGQDTILYLAENKNGLALTFANSTQRVNIYVNPYRTPCEKESISFDLPGVSYVYSGLEGGILHVFVEDLNNQSA